ncbi:MAG TPA: hypothetical protein VNV42_09255 [Solirubrobacteraceae bacterium]|jgi:DNA-binding helix-hairpin-helix protein with protein kinase domain|nr:hypothetical protein [Solirubrobacteraceae bacterium]
MSATRQQIARSRSLQNGGALGVAGSLAEGGEAVIYRLSTPRGLVLKEYKLDVLAKRGANLDAKLRAMLRNPPHDATRSDPRQKHVSIAWPELLTLDAAGAICGYLMPAIDTRKTVELHQVQNPSDRLRKDKTARDKLPPWLSGFTWRYLVRVAANLASAVAAIHEAACVIGDFNGRNVLVSESTLVTILDCDSFQVPGEHGETFLCTVQLPGTHPPEIMRADLSSTVREPAGDLHLLAVHIYGLLMQGRYPYQGSWTGRGEKPSQADLKEKGIFHYGDRRLGAPLGIPPFTIFPKPLQLLFVRAFKDGALDPAARPSAEEWYSALSTLEATLAKCSVKAAHVYPAHLKSCPWCPLEASTLKATSKLAQRSLPPPPAPAQTRRSAGPAQRAPQRPPLTPTVVRPSPARPSRLVRLWWVPALIPIVGPFVSWSYVAVKTGKYKRWALTYGLLLAIVVASAVGASGSSSSSSSSSTGTSDWIGGALFLFWMFGPMVQAIRRRKEVIGALSSHRRWP